MLNSVDKADSFVRSDNAIRQGVEFVYIIVSAKGPGTGRMGVCQRNFISKRFAVFKRDDHRCAKGFSPRIRVVIPAGPSRVFNGADLMPEPDRIRPACPFGRITVDMMPDTVLERNRKNVHDTVVKGFPAGAGVEFLGVAGAAADDVMGMMAGVDDDTVDIVKV